MFEDLFNEVIESEKEERDAFFELSEDEEDLPEDLISMSEFFEKMFKSLSDEENI